MDQQQIIMIVVGTVLALLSGLGIKISLKQTPDSETVSQLPGLIMQVTELMNALQEHKTKCVRCNDHQEGLIGDFKEFTNDFYDARNAFNSDYQKLINQIDKVRDQLKRIEDMKPNAAIEKALTDVCATINQLSGSIDQISRNSSN